SDWRAVPAAWDRACPDPAPMPGWPQLPAEATKAVAAAYGLLFDSVKRPVRMSITPAGRAQSTGSVRRAPIVTLGINELLRVLDAYTASPPSGGTVAGGCDEQTQTIGLGATGRDRLRASRSSAGAGRSGRSHQQGSAADDGCSRWAADSHMGGV